MTAGERRGRAARGSREVLRAEGRKGEEEESGFQIGAGGDRRSRGMVDWSCLLTRVGVDRGAEVGPARQRRLLILTGVCDFARKAQRKKQISYN